MKNEIHSYDLLNGIYHMYRCRNIFPSKLYFPILYMWMENIGIVRNIRESQVVIKEKDNHKWQLRSGHREYVKGSSFLKLCTCFNGWLFCSAVCFCSWNLHLIHMNSSIHVHVCTMPKIKNQRENERQFFTWGQISCSWIEDNMIRSRFCTGKMGKTCQHVLLLK